MFKDIPAASEFTVVKEIKDGMSGDRKYYIETVDGQKLLLRISEAANIDIKKKDYEFLTALNKAKLSVPRAVDFGLCEEGQSVYMLLEWMEGEEAEKVLPDMPKDKQYRLGVKAGQILRGIHENAPVRQAQQDWFVRYFDVITPRLEAYKYEGIPFKGADEILAFIEDNKHLLHDRNQCNIHGDFHLGNLIIRGEDLFVIDWQTVDFEGVADPWVDFKSIGVEHTAFAVGQIDGYFDSRVPEAFWRMLALYLATSAITSIVWAKYVAPDCLESIMELNRNVVKWYDKMEQVIPTWYREYKEGKE